MPSLLESQGGHGKQLTLTVEWRPLYNILMGYLGGDAAGYNGAIPQAVHQAGGGVLRTSALDSR